jgi:hypothetical protein
LTERTLLQGDLEVLAHALPNLEFLGLADNLLGSWQHIVAIATWLPALRTLDVTGNRLSVPVATDAPEARDAATAAPRLHALVANRCHAAWNDVLRVAAHLPALCELYLAGNGIATLGPACAVSATAPGAPLSLDAQVAAALRHLTLLDLTDNGLACWAELRPLAALPSLADLKLSGNALGAVELAGARLRTPPSPAASPSSPSRSPCRAALLPSLTHTTCYDSLALKAHRTRAHAQAANPWRSSCPSPPRWRVMTIP